MGRIEAGIMSFVAFAASSISADASEQSRFPRVPEVTVARQAPQADPMEGAEVNACVSNPDSFELGAVDQGSFNDGTRILSSMGSYYFQRNVGSIERQLERADQYNASLANCSADDYRAAARLINMWFPDNQMQVDTEEPVTITSRSFVIAEIRRGLAQSIRNERRTGV